MQAEDKHKPLDQSSQPSTHPEASKQYSDSFPLISFKSQQVSIRLLNLKTRLCGFSQIHTVHSGSSMEKAPYFLEMNPGMGLAADVLEGPQPEEVSDSVLVLL